MAEQLTAVPAAFQHPACPVSSTGADPGAAFEAGAAADREGTLETVFRGMEETRLAHPLGRIAMGSAVRAREPPPELMRKVERAQQRAGEAYGRYAELARTMRRSRLSFFCVA